MERVGEHHSRKSTFYSENSSKPFLESAPCFSYSWEGEVFLVGKNSPLWDRLRDVRLVVVSWAPENAGLLNAYCPQIWGFKVMLREQESSLSMSCDTQGETRRAIYASIWVDFCKNKYINLIPHYPLLIEKS